MPMHYDESPEPMALELPPLPDELAVTMYELVLQFVEQFEARYQHQIHRVYYERDRERRELQCQELFERSQQRLPLEDDTPF